MTAEVAGAPSVRRASAADAAALAELAERTFRATYAHDIPEPDLAAHVAEQLAPEVLAPQLDAADAAWFLAEVHGVAAGFAELRDRGGPEVLRARRPMELGRLYVDAAHHGGGLAPALLGAVRAEARARGADVVWLVVWSENHRAIRFYAKHGFQRVGPWRFRVGSRWYDDDLMACALDGPPAEPGTRP